MIPKIEKIVRTLAKNHYYQLLYSQSKEIGTRVFRNIIDLTDVQIAFVQYMSFYNSLYIDLACGEVKEFVLNDQIYEDAYSTYKSEERMKSSKNLSQNSSTKSSENSNTTDIGTKKFIFKSPRKKH